MQFYVFSPIVLILHYKNKIFGYSSILALLLVNFIVTAVESAKNDYNPGIIYGLLNNEQFVNSYTKPYFRMGPYLFGLLFGFVFRGYTDNIAKENDKDFELCSLNDSMIGLNTHTKYVTNFESKIVNFVHFKAFRVFSYVFGTTLMVAVLYIPYIFETNGPDSWTSFEKVLYLSFEHLLFPFALVVVLMPLIAGYGGVMLKFLTNKYFSVVAKISFSYYLIHPFFIHFFAFNIHQSLYAEDMYMLYPFFGTVFLSLLSATVLTLMLESPVLALEKKLFSRK